MNSAAGEWWPTSEPAQQTCRRVASGQVPEARRAEVLPRRGTVDFCGKRGVAWEDFGFSLIGNMSAYIFFEASRMG